MMGLVAIAVLCASAAQIVQVYAARGLPAGARLMQTLTHPLVWLSYFLLGCSLAFWLIALTVLDVSQTYPLFAIGFVITMLYARFGLGDVVPLRSWAGAVLIVAGGVLCNS